MKKRKKIVALALTAIMSFSAFSSSGGLSFADEAVLTETIEEAALPSEEIEVESVVDEITNVQGSDEETSISESGTPSGELSDEDSETQSNETPEEDETQVIENTDNIETPETPDAPENSGMDVETSSGETPSDFTELLSEVMDARVIVLGGVDLSVLTPEELTDKFLDDDWYDSLTEEEISEQTLLTAYEMLAVRYMIVDAYIDDDILTSYEEFLDMIDEVKDNPDYAGGLIPEDIPVVYSAASPFEGSKVGTVNVSVGSKIWYGPSNQSNTNFMSISGTPSASNNNAYCVDPDKNTPSNGAICDMYEVSDAALKKILYYSVGAPGYVNNNAAVKDAITASGMPSSFSTDQASVILTHLALSKRMQEEYDADGDNGWETVGSSYVTITNKYFTEISKLGSVPNSFHAYYLVDGTTGQGIMTWIAKTTGSLSVKKALDDYAAGASKVDLTGVKFHLYTCTDTGNKIIDGTLGSTEIATFTCDSVGNTKVTYVDSNYASSSSQGTDTLTGLIHGDYALFEDTSGWVGNSSKRAFQKISVGSNTVKTQFSLVSANGLANEDRDMGYDTGKNYTYSYKSNQQYYCAFTVDDSFGPDKTIVAKNWTYRGSLSVKKALDDYAAGASKVDLTGVKFHLYPSTNTASKIPEGTDLSDSAKIATFACDSAGNTKLTYVNAAYSTASVGDSTLTGLIGGDYVLFEDTSAWNGNSKKRDFQRVSVVADNNNTIKTEFSLVSKVNGTQDGSKTMGYGSGMAYYTTYGNNPQYYCTLTIENVDGLTKDIVARNWTYRGSLTVKKALNDNPVGSPAVDLTGIKFHVYPSTNTASKIPEGTDLTDLAKIATFITDTKGNTELTYVNAAYSTASVGDTELTGLISGDYVLFEDTSGWNGNSQGKDFERVSVVAGDEKTVKTEFSLVSKENGTQNGSKDMGYGSGRAYYTTYGPHPQYYCTFTVENTTGLTKDVIARNYLLAGVKIKKKSANTSITDNNSCYSIKGAVYAVYDYRWHDSVEAATESNYTTLSGYMGALTTDENGDTNTLTLDANKYYIKEVKAPYGYALDENIYECDLSDTTKLTNNVYILNVTDLPQMDPIGIILEKVDSKGVGLAGAQFTIKFYQGTYSDGVDPATLGKTPDRKWVLETDANGKAKADDNYKISGDAWYKNPNTNAIEFPLGTVTIQETLAPEGYLLNPTVYVRKITEEHNGTSVVSTYNTPTVPNTAEARIKLVKTSSNTTVTSGNASYSLKDAVYAVYDNPTSAASAKATSATDTSYTGLTGYVGSLTTDANGNSNTITGLEPGTYYVKEVIAPKGFKLNTTVYTVNQTDPTIYTNNTYTVQSEETPITANIKLKKTSANTSVTNGNANYSLKGAVYAVYTNPTSAASAKATSATDNSYTNLDGYVGKLTTDASGNSNTLTNLGMGKYYVKEVIAPKNFKLDTNVYTVDQTNPTIYTNNTYTVQSSEAPYTANLKLVKKSANTTITNGNSNYSLKDAVYAVYTNPTSAASAKATSATDNSYTNLDGYVGKLTTDASGNTNTITGLSAGMYYVKEVVAPKNFKLDTTVYTVNQTNPAIYTNNTYTVQSEEAPETAGIKLVKKSANTTITNGNSNYSLKDAVYAVYNNQDDANKAKSTGATPDYYNTLTGYVGKLTTDANGNTNTISGLPAGTYYIKEVIAGKGFDLDKNVYSVNASTPASQVNRTYTVNSLESPKTLSITLKKTSNNTAITNGNTYYSKAGAVYAVYNVKASATSASGTNYTTLAGYVGKLITDENGNSNTLTGLSAGMYYVKEVIAPKNFKLDTTVHTVDATNPDAGTNRTFTVNSGETPVVGKLTLKKKSGDTSVTNSNPNYSLAGAVYAVYNNESSAGAANGTNYETLTGYVGKLTTDENGNTNALSDLPAGKYYVKEVIPSKGYDLDRNIHPVDLTNPASLTNNTFTVNSVETPVTLTLALRKSSGNTAITNGNANYSLKGAVYAVYESNESANTATGTNYKSQAGYVGAFTTDENGKTTALLGLPAKTYYVKEVIAPKGFELDTAVYTANGTNPLALTNRTITISTTDTPYVANLKLVKKSSNTAITNGNANYSLKGAVYAVYTNQTSASSAKATSASDTSYTNLDGYVGKLTTDENGNTNTLTGLPANNYYVKEVIASKGFDLDTKVYTVDHTNPTIYTNNTYTVQSAETPITASINLLKKSGNTAITNGNPNYSLKGAVYAVYTNQTSASSAKATSASDTSYTNLDGYVGKLTTDENGKTNTISGLPAKNYYVKEVIASKGYDLDTTVYTANQTNPTIYTNRTFTVNSAEAPITAKISLVKKSADTSISNGNANYSLKDAVYAVFTDKTSADSATKDNYATLTGYVGKLTTDENGNSNTLTGLPANTYYIKEVIASKGFALDTKVYTVDHTNPAVHTNRSYTVNSSEMPQYNPVNVLVIKKDAEYNTPLADAEFTIRFYPGNYAANVDPATVGATPSKTFVVKTKADGTAATTDMVSGSDWYKVGDTPVFPLGTVTIVETKAPVGFHADTNTHVVKITGTNSPVVAVVNEYAAPEVGNVPIKQAFELIKLGETTDNGVAPLKGAGFSACNVADLSKDENGNYIWDDSKRVEIIAGAKEMFTDENGYAKSQPLRYGTYLVRETTVPANMLRVSDFTVTIVDDAEPVQALRYITDGRFRAYLRIVKQDKNSTKPIISDNASFKIWSYDNNEYVKFTVPSGEGTKTVDTFDTVGGMLITPDSIPAGKYRIEEVKTPYGYIDEDSKVDFTITNTGVYEVYYDENGKVTDMGIFTVTMNNTPYEGRLELTKVGEEYEKNDAGEWIKKDIRLSGVTFGVYALEDIYSTDGQDLVFAKGDAVEEITTDKNGFAKTTVNLPEGKYIVKELTTPDEYYKAEDVKFDISFANVDANVDVVKEITVINYKKIELGTTARDSETKDNVSSANKPITIIDKVACKNLVVGHTYTIKGVLMDKTTNAPFMVDGKEVTAQETFKATNGYQEVDITFPSFDSSLIKGKSVVVFERIYEGSRELATHTEIEDEGQTVDVPEIGTKASDIVTGDDVSSAERDITITDKVSCTNLTIGKEYIIKATLMQKKTNKPLLVNGLPVVAEKKFTATKKNDVVEVTFPTFSSKELKGGSVVAFERMYHNDIEVASHTDIEDDEQTVKFPEISTSASEISTNDGVASAEKEITITDVVTYKNLVPGKSYTLKAKLMLKSANAPLLVDGKEITAKVTFTADKADGTKDVTFPTFDASYLKGESVVVFERLYHNDIEVATHTEIDDLNQTIDFPEVKTSASEIDTEDNVANADKEVTITDIVSYTNLVIGKEYTVKGVLMNKKTNSPLLVDGEEVAAEETFIADKKDGTIELTFPTFSAENLKGESVVAFERFYHNDIEVGSHTEIEDKEQTIDFPDIRTMATNEDGNKAFAFTDKNTITLIDTVSYNNLTTGRTYKLTGTLMDKNTNTLITNLNGMPIVATKEFTPTEMDGEVPVTYVIENASEVLGGKTIVVFELLTFNGAEVAKHTEIDDVDQTVEFPSLGTTMSEAESGLKTVVQTKKVTLVDKVSYTNLQTDGRKYILKGKLMDKETNTPFIDADGKEVSIEKEFVPKESSGIEEVVFTFNAQLGKTYSVVAFEECWEDEEERLVCFHCEIDDDEQTVEFPELALGTTATLIDGEKDMEILDRCRFRLPVGYIYEISGVLMDKSTGKELLIDGEPITAKKTFTPDTEYGEITVIYPLDTSKFVNVDIDIVVFEEVRVIALADGTPITYQDVVIAHKDINDEGQTVKVKLRIGPITGDETPIEFLAIIAVMSLIAIALITRRRIRN